MKNTEFKKAGQVWKRDEVESPCVSICLMHPKEKICIGCFRTVDEITGWSKMSVEERKEIIEELPSRTSRTTKRRGGRSARILQKRKEL